MSAALPNLESISCFLAAARTLNFRAAAKTGALTPAAFGKRIKQLEAQLGCRLFERSTRHVTLTPNGEAMLPEARALLHTANRCVHAGRGSADRTDCLSIGTRYELGLSWLVPMLTDLSINSHVGSTITSVQALISRPNPSLRHPMCSLIESVCRPPIPFGS